MSVYERQREVGRGKGSGMISGMVCSLRFGVFLRETVPECQSCVTTFKPERLVIAVYQDDGFLRKVNLLIKGNVSSL